MGLRSALLCLQLALYLSSVPSAGLRIASSPSASALLPTRHAPSPFTADHDGPGQRSGQGHGDEMRTTAGRDGRTVQSEGEGPVARRLRAQLQQLQRLLDAERARSGRLERELLLRAGRCPPPPPPHRWRAPADAVPWRARGRRHNTSSLRLLSTCPVPPNQTMALPGGSFPKSCTQCFRFGDSLRCRCFRESDVDPSAGLLLPRGNLSGLWALQYNDWDSSTRVQLETYNLRHISMAIETPDWLRFTYIFESLCA
jgi:hypothetical protein